MNAPLRRAPKGQELPPADLLAALNDAAASHAYVRLFYGDQATGAARPLTANTQGRARITDQGELALILPDATRWLLDASEVVGVMGEGRQWLWRHPLFDVGVLSYTVGAHPEYRDRRIYTIRHNGKRVEDFARQRTMATRLAYLNGRRFGP